jgi:hypothetical protein
MTRRHDQHGEAGRQFKTRQRRRHAGIIGFGEEQDVELGRGIVERRQGCDQLRQHSLLAIDRHRDGVDRQTTVVDAPAMGLPEIDAEGLHDRCEPEIDQPEKDRAQQQGNGEEGLERRQRAAKRSAGDASARNQALTAARTGARAVAPEPGLIEPRDMAGQRRPIRRTQARREIGRRHDHDVVALARSGFQQAPQRPALGSQRKAEACPGRFGDHGHALAQDRAIAAAGMQSQATDMKGQPEFTR